MTRHFYLFLMLFLAVVITTWLAFSLSETKPQTKKNDENAKDAFATEVHITNMDKTGHINSQIETPYLSHFAAHNHTTLQSPSVTLYHNNQPPWKITAKQGSLLHGTEEMILSEKVILHQPKGVKNEAITVETESLTVFPAQQIAKTDLPITFTSESAQIRSTGLHANLKQGTLELKANTQGQYALRSP